MLVLSIAVKILLGIRNKTFHNDIMRAWQKDGGKIE